MVSVQPLTNQEESLLQEFLLVTKVLLQSLSLRQHLLHIVQAHRLVLLTLPAQQDMSWVNYSLCHHGDHKLLIKCKSRYIMGIQI